MAVMDTLKSALPHSFRANLGRVKRIKDSEGVRRARDAASAFRNGNGYRLEIGRFGNHDVAYRAGTADEDVIAHSFDNDIFLAAVPGYVAAPDHTIVDVGAHIGTFSLFAASKIPSGRVYAIEASRETFNFLRINACLNKLDNMTVSHLALSDRAGTAVLHHDLATGNWGHSIMKQLSTRGEEVQTQALTDYLAQNGIDHVNFMKFNCEGAEFPILMSATLDTLAKIDIMLVLYHCDLASSYGLDELISHLNRGGFSTRLFNQLGQRGWIIASRTAEPSVLLARP